MTQSCQIRVLVIDYYEQIRFSFVFFLEITAGFELLGEAPDIETGLVLCAHLQPDVVIVELGLSAQCGVDLIHQLMGWYPDVKIILMGAGCSEDEIAALLQAGASRYLTKNASVVELEETLQTVVGSSLDEGDLPGGWP